MRWDSIMFQFGRRGPWCRTLRRRGQAMVDALLHPYRPELYYMRGPGPKWRAKNGPVR